MHDFILREIKNTDIETELYRIGFDKSYVEQASEKYDYKNIKIYNLTPAQANILKQTAISAGCDCATHREVITGKIEKSDCILGGSISEIKKVAEKLKFQPFGLKELSKKLRDLEGFKDLNDKLIKNKPDCFAHNDREFVIQRAKPEESQNHEILRYAQDDRVFTQDDEKFSLAPCERADLRTDGAKQVRIANRLSEMHECAKSETLRAWSKSKTGQGEGCKLVGILNITDNSFSDGGLYNNFEKAKEHLLDMINDGADIIDIGAESTKPYSTPVTAEEQLKKLLPIIDFAKDKITLSIDTRSAIVAEECLKSGAHIINDVSGFDYDGKMPDIIAKYNAPVIIQHSKGTPETMQKSPHYDDLIEEIFLSLYKKITFAKSKGITNIIIDPGIGFGKSVKDNFEIIRRIEEFKSLGCPIMLGISRKSLLNMADADNFTKDIYTTALNAIALDHKVDYIRVHNVKMHKKLIDLMRMFMVE